MRATPLFALSVSLTAFTTTAYGGTPPSRTAARAPSHPATYAAGSVLVGFRAGTPAGQTQKLLRAVGAVALRHEGVGAVQVRVPAGEETSVATALRADPRVRYAEPDYYSVPTGTPSDPGFPNQWGLQNTGQTVNGIAGTAGADANAVPAWSITTGNPAIVVAEVDTGVDYTHPDLAANIWTNDGTVGGCPAGTHGYNAIKSTCDPMDDDTSYGGHGTHVAGIIGAVGDNGVGVAGVNWHTTILPVKWIPSSGAGATSNLVGALDWVLQAQAAGVNVRIVNDSNVFVGTAYSQALADEIDLLAQHGILFVTAAGSTGGDNDNPAQRRYPCGYARSNELCATWTNQRDTLPSGANFGATSVDLAAPGDNIYSTLRNGGYGFVSGGSMAAAAVSGAAALVLSARDMTTPQLKADLLEHAKPLASLIGKVRSGGRLDICASVPGCGSSGTAFTGTFGTTSVGGSTDTFLADRKRVNKAALTKAGALTKLSVYLSPTSKAGTQNLRGVIYSDVTGRPRALLGTTTELTFSSTQPAGWYDLPLATPLSLQPGTYWIGAITGASSGVAGFRWTSVSGSRAYNSNSYANGPSNPFGGATLDSEQTSLFATYTTSQLPPFAVTPPRVVNQQSQPGHPSPEPQVGLTLTAGTGDWDFAPSSYSYQWGRCDATGSNCTSLAGATSSSYQPVSADVGSTLQVTVTARNTAGPTASRSVPTLVVQAAAPAGTFGKTAMGGTSDPADANWTRLDAFQLPSNGLVSSLSLYLGRNAAGSQSVRGLIYADNAGVPGALLGRSSDLTLSSTDVSGWYALPFAAAVPLTAGTYWIGAQFGATTRVFALRYDDSTAGSGAIAPAPFTVAPPTTGWRLQAEQASVYATYTTTP